MTEKFKYTLLLENQGLLPKGLLEEIMITAGLQKLFFNIWCDSWFRKSLMQRACEMFHNGSIPTNAFELYELDKLPKVQKEMGTESLIDLKEVLRVMVSSYCLRKIANLFVYVLFSKFVFKFCVKPFSDYLSLVLDFCLLT